MKPFNKEKKTTVLVVKFLINEHFLSPNRNPMTSSLSSNKKKRVKMSKIKFGIKIEFCKIQENDYLIAKINKGLK